MNVLVTGGAGYIGSHVCRDLLAAGHDVVIVDDLSRGRAWTTDRLRELAGDAKRVAFHKCDVCDEAAIARAFETRPVDGVIHCAGVAYVSESIADPAKYDRINTGGTRAMLRACERFGVPRFLFSSSCTTYGDPGAAALPVREECPQRPMNPYGWSKLNAEKAVIDAQANRVASARPLHAAILRYFNVAGCDRAGILGHDFDPETRVIPLCIMAALGKPGAVPFRVFGDDYATPDGTCIRDYIHPDDVAAAHLRVLENLPRATDQRGATDGPSAAHQCIDSPTNRSTDVRGRPSVAPHPRIYNLGTGKGVSVREIIAAVERVTGRRVPVEMAPRREGDPAALYCDPSRIQRELGWKAACSSLDEIVATAARWIAGR